MTRAEEIRAAALQASASVNAGRLTRNYVSNDDIVRDARVFEAYIRGTDTAVDVTK